MSVTVGFLALLEARPDDADELAAFLEQGRELALAEPLTVDWYAFRIDQVTYAIFDTFEAEAGREAIWRARSPRRSWRPRRNCSRRIRTSRDSTPHSRPGWQARRRPGRRRSGSEPDQSQKTGSRPTIAGVPGPPSLAGRSSHHSGSQTSGFRCRWRTQAVTRPRAVRCASEHECGSRSMSAEAPARRQSRNRDAARR